MPAPDAVFALDIGGSGARWRLAAPAGAAQGPPWASGETSTVPASDLATEIFAAAGSILDGLPDTVRVTAVAIGSRGAASRLADPSALAAAICDRAGGVSVAVAADTVTAHLGALQGRSGAVIAVGTGAIALGSNGSSRWIRAGGWGPLYDDLGSGYWIGAHALSLAVRHHDAIAGAADAGPLLEAAIALFGPVPSWPEAIYGQDDRIARIAQFARVVADLGAAGDGASTRLISHAASHAARTLAACIVDDVPPHVAATGGVAAGCVFRAELVRCVRDLRPDATWFNTVGTPLDGAILLARRAAAQAVTPIPGLLWTHPAPR